jgi:hypothetical protein
MRLEKYPSQAARPLRLRLHGGRLLRRIAWVVLATLVLALALAVFMVATGPTDFGIVRERMATIIRGSIGPGYSVDIGRALVDIDPVMGLVIRVDNLDIRDSNKVVVAHLPLTRFAVDPYALAGAKVEIRQIELSQPVVSFARGEGGEVYLGTAATPAPPPKPAASAPPISAAEIDAADGGFPDLVAALYVLDRGIEPDIEAATRAGFERFAIVNGTVTISGAGGSAQRSFPGTDLNVTLDRASASVSATLATSGYGGRWTATIDRHLDAASGRHEMSAVFSQLTVADLLPALGAENAMATADIPLYGRANIQFDKAGQVTAATARLDLGAGYLRFGEDHDTVLLDEATVQMHWDIADRALIVDPSTFFFGDTRAVVTGKITPDGQPADHRYAFDLSSPGAVLAPSDTGLPPMIAQRMEVSGTVDLKAKQLNLEDAVINSGDATIAAAGSIGFSGVSPSLAMAATFSPMSVAQLKQMWVPLIASGARKWVMKNVTAGRLVAGKFEASVPPGMLWTGKRMRLPDDVLHLDMQVDGVAFNTFGQLPQIVNASGHITVAGSTVGVDVDKAQVDVPSGTVNVDNGAFAVPNAAKHPADGIIALQLSGSAQALAEIADAEPLHALAKAKLGPADLSGKGSANISIKLPLRDGLTDADVDWKVVVNTNDVASKAPIQGRLVSAANVVITATPDDISVYGKEKIDGVPADVSMSFPTSSSLAAIAGNAGDKRVRLLLDDDARKKLGVGLDDMLSGTVSALVSDLPGGAGQHYDLDLKRARLSLPGIGWTKGIGVPATLAFDMKPAGDGFAVDNLALSGDGFGFSGSAQLDASHALQSADVTHLSLHPGDDVSLKLTRGRNGYALTARGSSFDVRGLLTNVRDKNNQSGGFPDLALDARVDRLVGFNQQEINGVSLTLVSVGGETQKLSFSGAIGSQPLSLDYNVGPEGTKLSGKAADAGGVLRFVNIYSHVSGGTMTLDGAADKGQPVTGTMTIDEFDIVNEPAMARVMGSDTTAPVGNPDFNPNRVHFTRMLARYRRSDHVLAVEDALLAGPAVGATFSGRYDIAAAQVDIAGTYLPAYALNNLFSRIPIVGFALGGAASEGLIGVTFKVQGPIDQPEVFFNPLSAVAPGIFRKIFEFERPDDEQQ